MTWLDQHPLAGRARRHPIRPTAHRKEVSDMNAFIDIQRAFAAERAAWFQAEAQAARIADAARAARRAAGADERRIRRAVGRSIARIGARIAADPAVERCLVAAPPGGGGVSLPTFDGATLQ